VAIDTAEIGAEIRVRPTAGLLDQRYAPASGITPALQRAQSSLCACRGHLAEATRPRPELEAEVTALIELSGRILELDRMLGGDLAAIRHNQRAQWVSALADLVEKCEEVYSREDVLLSEVVADAISFGLNRIGDYSYVLSARSDSRGDLENFRPLLEEQLGDLLAHSGSGDPAAAGAVTEALFAPHRRPEELGALLLALLVAIFLRRCALFARRLTQVLQETHLG
jgi:hypothetical protein